LQKLLSQAGVSSRRKADELIREGRVRLNGKVVTELGTKANPRTDRISVDGRQVHLGQPIVYLILNKPVGVLTTASDPEGRPTVMQLLPRLPARVYSVGRLDFHSSGLLLFTNDGDLAMRLTHPRYGVPKVYRVKVRGVPTSETMERWRTGVRLEEGKTAPAEVRLIRSSDGKAWLEMTLAEGRRREIRRMCEYVGHPVEKLQRVSLGPISLGNLAVGEHRLLRNREVMALRAAAGLPQIQSL
jgi:23S rRNA pseudouridine2605 synthase